MFLEELSKELPQSSVKDDIKINVKAESELVKNLSNFTYGSERIEAKT